MTDRKDFKRRVRERQARTGETYTAARAQVEAGAQPVPVVEMVDLTESAARLGFVCEVSASAALLERTGAQAVLRQLRDALLAVDGDPSTEVMRALAFHGVTSPLTPETAGYTRVRDFLRRARAGLGGSLGGGRLLVLQVGSEQVLYLAWPSPPVAVAHPPPPRIVISSLETAEIGGDAWVAPR